jgi:thymidylate kinase
VERLPRCISWRRGCENKASKFLRRGNREARPSATRSGPSYWTQLRSRCTLPPSFSAARAQHVLQVIRPHLASGGVVLCDRFSDSSLAYQGYGHEQDLEQMNGISRYATGGLMPDVTLYLDVPVEVGLQRKLKGTGDVWDRMEQKEVSFHQRVRSGYLAMAAQEPARWIVVDATGDVEEVQAAVRKRIQERAVLGRSCGGR